MYNPNRGFASRLSDRRLTGFFMHVFPGGLIPRSRLMRSQTVVPTFIFNAERMSHFIEMPSYQQKIIHSVSAQTTKRLTKNYSLHLNLKRLTNHTRSQLIRKR